MAHEVEKMVFAGSTPWHGLGTQIDEATGFWDAFNQAGLNWEVETEPLYRENGDKVKAQASVRQSDGRVLGVVGPRWTRYRTSTLSRSSSQWLIPATSFCLLRDLSVVASVFGFSAS